MWRGLVACIATINWMCQSFNTQFAFVSKNFLFYDAWISTNPITTTQQTLIPNTPATWTQITSQTKLCKYFSGLSQLIVKVRRQIDKQIQCLIAKCFRNLWLSFALDGFIAHESMYCVDVWKRNEFIACEFTLVNNNNSNKFAARKFRLEL